MYRGVFHSGNFREFLHEAGGGEFLTFRTGIPGGLGYDHDDDTSTLRTNRQTNGQLAYAIPRAARFRAVKTGRACISHWLICSCFYANIFFGKSSSSARYLFRCGPIRWIVSPHYVHSQIIHILMQLFVLFLFTFMISGSVSRDEWNREWNVYI